MRMKKLMKLYSSVNDQAIDKGGHLVAIAQTVILVPYHPGHVTATGLKIGFQLMISTGTQSSNEECLS